MTGIVSGKAGALSMCLRCGFIMTIRLHDGWGCGWCGAITDGRGRWAWWAW